MADKEHLNILKNGIKLWNEWRKRNPNIRPSLSEARLTNADFTEIDLSASDLRRANFIGSSLRRADLRKAVLIEADLRRSHLADADLREANLRGANLRGADVRGINLTGCIMGWTIVGGIDLRVITGLETIKHEGPSMIGVDTIYLSEGNIPEIFLQGTGIPNALIASLKVAVNALRPIDFYSCFISYSSKDYELAERLHADLQSNGVRCWFAPEDLKIGDKLRPAFDEAIRIHDKLMVILSKSSVRSPWVEKEVETAFEKERQQNRTVLFPIRLDDAVMETDEAWAADMRRTRHIGDFRDWRNHDSYKKAFDRLLRDLRAKSVSAAKSGT